MRDNIRVNGWDFEYVSSQSYDGGDDQFYQCRGEVMYDDEHDEIPEPSLWRAALELEKQLTEEGFRCDANHSEKGWVEVTIFNKT